MGPLPSREFGINQTWLLLTGIAADLIAWTCEPKALRYRFLHVPARFTHAARRRRLRIPDVLALGGSDRRRLRNIAAIPQTRHP